jgi:hypothetical protein
MYLPLKIALMVAGTTAGSLACASTIVLEEGVVGSGGAPSTTTSRTPTTGGASTTTTTAGTTTTSTSATTTTSTTGTSGTTSTGTSSGAPDAGPCSKPGTLHPPQAGSETLYCPFAADGGALAFCNPRGQHCCETPEGAPTASACEPTTTACLTGYAYMDWGCADPVADCPSGSECCAPGATLALGAPGCGNFSHDMTITKCVAAGSCSGIRLCTADAECPPPMKCTPFNRGGNHVGGCM